MLALLLAAAASAAPTSPPAAEDVWRGTMSYPCTAACHDAFCAATTHSPAACARTEAFDALGRTGRLDKRAVIQICPSRTEGMCGYSKTTINEVVAAGYKVAQARARGT